MRGRTKKRGGKLIVDLRLVDVTKLSPGIFFGKPVIRVLEDMLRDKYVGTYAPTPRGTYAVRSSRSKYLAKTEVVFWALRRILKTQKVTILLFLTGVLVGVGMGVAACSL